MRNAFELSRKQSRCRKIVYKRNDKTLNKQLSLNIKNDFDGEIKKDFDGEYVTTKPTGTGLGLPIVKKILDDHGAAIKLKNRSNEETGEILGASVEIVFKVSRLEHNPISN